MFAIGLAEEAPTAGPRTTEAEREAAKHQPQQTLLWVNKRLLAQHKDIIALTEFSPLLTLIFDLCHVAVTLTSMTGSVTEKGVNCRRLKDQLDTLERETTDKLAQMEQYNKELKVSGRHRLIQDI